MCNVHAICCVDNIKEGLFARLTRIVNTFYIYKFMIFVTNLINFLAAARTTIC